MFERLYSLLSGNRRPVTVLFYSAVAASSYWLAFVLRFDFTLPPEYSATFAVTLPLFVVIRLAFVGVFRLSTGRWRFISTQDVVLLVLAGASGTVIFLLGSRILPLSPTVPRSVILIEGVLNVYMTAGAWMGYRVLFEWFRLRRMQNGSTKRVLIVGAGEAGNLLAREMLRFPTGYRPVGFADDDVTKRGVRIHGVEVLGTIQDVPRLAKARRAHEIIVAVPRAKPSELRTIVAQCEASDLPFRVLPGIAEVLMGDVTLKHLRKIEVGDLLGRDPVRLDLPEVTEDIFGRSVLITGAAGSIGSELAEQIAHYSPSLLILLDQAETDLYYLELNLRNRFDQLPVVAVVGDIVDAGAMEQLFRRYRPQRVFHAAAYKHVPLMEQNPREALRNNVFGTWRVAGAAGRHGTEKFVLVSTDKAAHPVSIMGATKWIAEQIVLQLQKRFPSTLFTAVRFGNVLGSKGSVIPVFRRQIDAGQPLTVTHPDVTRYFMTISEAVQLVLQASLLPDLRGHVAMLEMGDPVRIVDLAKNMLRLSGRSHQNGTGVVFTGLRPGEKLHEQLVGRDERTESTSIPKVKRVIREGNAVADIGGYMAHWERLCDECEDAVAVAELLELIPAGPSSAMVDRDQVESVVGSRA